MTKQLDDIEKELTNARYRQKLILSGIYNLLRLSQHNPNNVNEYLLERMKTEL